MRSLHDGQIQTRFTHNCQLDIHMNVQKDRNSLLSANRMTSDRHKGHFPFPAFCIFTKHLTQNKWPQASLIGLNAIEVQIKQA